MLARTASRLVLPLLVAALLALPSAAGAETFTVGSTLQAVPNTNFGCNARPYPGFNDQLTFIDTHTSSCTWWSTGYGTTIANGSSTYLPRGTGRVIMARVRSGPNPAPLKIAIISSSSGLCCTGRLESDVFQPTPNAITEVPLNLEAASGISLSPALAYNDIVAVTGVGPGTLPIHDYGTHLQFSQAAGTFLATFAHPAVTPGQPQPDIGAMDGYEVLLQAVWCGTLQSTPSAAQACPAAGGPGGGGGPGAAPLSARGGSAAVNRGKAALRLRCTAATACVGRIVLLPRKAAKPVLGGKRRFTLGAGKQGTVRAKLTKAGRKRLKHGPVKVNAVVTMKDGTTTTLKLKLKRG